MKLLKVRMDDIWDIEKKVGEDDGMSFWMELKENKGNLVNFYMRDEDFDFLYCEIWSVSKPHRVIGEYFCDMNKKEIEFDKKLLSRVHLCLDKAFEENDLVYYLNK